MEEEEGEAAPLVEKTAAAGVTSAGHLILRDSSLGPAVSRDGPVSSPAQRVWHTLVCAASAAVVAAAAVTAGDASNDFHQHCAESEINSKE